MGSFTQLTYHIVFATWYRKPVIVEPIRERLYEYMGGIVRAKHGVSVEIGGVTDHVHVLARLSPALALSDVVRDLKASSSKWLKEQTRAWFAWQKGFGAFTVSYSNIESVAEYIKGQEEHHRRLTFQEEYVAFLRRHGIEYRLEHLFEDEHQG